jgi:protein-S-isoprenylcysteine O-methyltransferase Ste14
VDHTERPPLATQGIFRLVRNPVYGAIVVMVAGLTLLVPNSIAWIGVAVAVVGAQLQVRLIEEPYLRDSYGSAYRDYTAHVGRFMPGVGKSR